ncbi:MAG: leucine-rich repeat protein [Coriobacteriales bacterium]
MLPPRPYIQGRVTGCCSTSAATAEERESEVTAYVKKLAGEPFTAAITKAKAYTNAASHAFIYDCPEVFWLGDDSYTSEGTSYSWSDPSTIVVGETEYKVTGTKAVALTKPPSSAAKVFVPATITAGGITYKITALAASAFAGSKAKTISVGANVAAIGNKAFANCANLTSLTLGAAVKTIGTKALCGSKKLTNVTVNSSKLTKASITNLLKGTQVKTIKCGKNVTKKAKASYRKWAKAAKKGAVVK